MKSVKKLLSSLVFLASVVLVVPGQAWAQVATSSEQEQWKVMPTNSFGDAAGHCFGTACKTAQLLQVCMYRDPSTAGFFAHGEWRSHVGESAPQPCQEFLYAKPTHKILFFLAQFQAMGSGQPYIYCPHDPTRQRGSKICLSEFLTLRDTHSSSYRVIDLSTVQKAVQEAKVIDAIDKHLQAVAAQQSAQQRAEYLAEFERAKDSLQAIQQFEAKYGSNDPDALIPQLAGLKQEFRLKEYEERFAKLATVPEIERFIADYERDDLGKKLPYARQRLAQEKQREAVAAKVQEQQKVVEEHSNRLQMLERRMAWCKREMEGARRVIEQENQIGRVSGFVNKQRLRAAGEAIVVCERGNREDIEEYRRLGGKKSYAELR